MKTFLLPSQFKLIGLIAIVFFISVSVFLKDYAGIGDNLDLYPLVQLSISLGLVMIVSAREKDEDEMILQLRLQSFQTGLYLCIFLFYLIRSWQGI